MFLFLLSAIWVGWKSCRRRHSDFAWSTWNSTRCSLTCKWSDDRCQVWLSNLFIRSIYYTHTQAFLHWWAVFLFIVFFLSFSYFSKRALDRERASETCPPVKRIRRSIPNNDSSSTEESNSDDESSSSSEDSLIGSDEEFTCSPKIPSLKRPRRSQRFEQKASHDTRESMNENVVTNQSSSESSRSDDEIETCPPVKRSRYSRALPCSSSASETANAVPG